MYQALTRSEVRYLKASLKAFHTKGENRPLKLIEYLEKKPGIGNAEMAELLYGDPRSKAFIMMKGRLLERMLEVMTLNVNLTNNKVVKKDPSRMAIISMQKMLSYAALLHIRGLYQLERELVEKTQKMAREHGYPEIEVQCAAYQCNLTDSLEELEQEYQPAMYQALEAYRSDLMALDMMTEYRLLGRGDRLHDDTKVAELLTERTQKLERRLTQYPSLRGQSYLLTLRGVVYQLQGKYEACREVIQQLLHLYQSHPGLGNKYRMGALYFQLADMEARSLHFSEAIEATKQVRKSFPSSKPNYFKGSILMIFAYLYTGQLDRARAVIDELQALDHLSYTQQLMPVVAYLEACWHYLRGNHTATCQLLAEDRGLTQDKSGWNVGLRMFEILILLEMESHQVADAKVENLRKHIARYGADPRNYAIFRLLQQASRYEFDFTPIQEKVDDTFSQLEEKAWVPISHEVIRFETWYQAYQQQRPYLEVMQEELHRLQV